jgi:hypothetical protein
MLIMEGMRQSVAMRGAEKAIFRAVVARAETDANFRNARRAALFSERFARTGMAPATASIPVATP